MSRVKRGVTAHAKHKKVLKAAKGYFGRRKNTIRIAKQAVEKAMQYAYRDRKNRKRTFRALWIQRINAAVRAAGYRPDLFAIYRRSRQGRGRDRSQGAVRPRDSRAGGVQGAGREGQGRARRLTHLSPPRRGEGPSLSEAACRRGRTSPHGPRGLAFPSPGR